MTAELAVGPEHRIGSALVDIAAESLSLRDKVNAIEAEMRKLPALDLPLKHHFSPGVYARELFIPKGTLLTGKVHKYPQLNIMSQGDMSVLTEDGIVRVKAPFTVVSPAGTKRIAYAHEDTVWTTILATDETDIAKLEALFVVDTDEDYAAFRRSIETKEAAKCLS